MIAGVLNDRVTSFSGVLSIRHSMSLGSYKSYLSVFLMEGDCNVSARSIGLRPCSSRTFLEAPLMSRDLTGLVF